MRAGGQLYSAFVALLLGTVLFLYVYGGGFRNGFKIPFSWRQPTMGFVYRSGTQFFVDDGGGERSCSASMCQPVYVNGWNSYWMLEASAAGDGAKVSEMLRRGREMGMGVCRAWAFSDGEGGLQVEPGRFDERTFQALDYVIYEARRTEVRLILSLVNNLGDYGGKPKYVEWARKAGANVSDSGDAFFSHPTIKAYYKDYVKAILTRKNSYSGIKYTDEPAIFAWELMNEPRCVCNSSAAVLQAWISEMASYVKHLDKKHLVTVGLEGFYGAKRPEKLMANPGDWAASFCSDFIQNSATEHIDFASVHAYPDSWIPHAHLKDKAKYLAKWVDSHVNDGEYILKKPVLFTEVGSSHMHANHKQGLYGIDILLKTVYDKIYRSAQKSQAGAGAFIWQLLVEGIERYEDQFSLVVKEHRTAYISIMQQSCRLQYMLRKGERSRTVGWPCVGIKF